MALEAVVFPQDRFTYGYNSNYYGHLQAASAEEEEKFLLGIINNNNIEQNLHTSSNWDSSNSTNSLLQQQQNVKDQQLELYSPHSSSPEEACCTVVDQPLSTPPFFPPAPLPSTVEAATTTSRRKRRRTKSTKNKEEIENQRMTHIAVERNRRKQMNEYLAVLRSLMPSSYVQRGDQASIIGGAINFVKELEQLLQSMGGQKKTHENLGLNNGSSFAEFFTFPQYTTTTTRGNQSSNNNTAMEHNHDQTQTQTQKQWAVADIEVTMVDSHANMKILSKKRNGQLMKIVVGLQSLRLSILHLNVTTLDDMVLYSVSVKVEEGSRLNTVDEIAAAVNQLLRTVQEEVAFN